MAGKVVLTGIKPTGIPHIGNYFGAIRPALGLAGGFEARYFIADYHALNSVQDAATMRDYTYQIAATWIACGLDPKKVLLYRQSDVPETFELSTFLMAFTAKGLMNRAHAYKDAFSKNLEKGVDQDHEINMGLFTYPVLMAADILLFDTDLVPVGRDQKQHIEIACDIAQRINHNYGAELLRVPQPVISSTLDLIPGLDGRKMSKSYGNTIPLWLPSKELRKLLMKITTNSQGVEEVKDPETCNIFALYKLFANDEQQAELAARYRAGGLGWGHAKQALFEVVDAHLAPMREKYEALIADKATLDAILDEGAARARVIASATMGRLRKAAGLGR
ncbi:MAG: hypothetical protein RL095_719 [Verrucomicrobiota bacterium]|jgi:tryptophanyl-tRNA synthetase